MFENAVPKHRVGVLLPLSVIDNAAYEFYRLAPEGVIQVMIPIGLGEFSKADVERALSKPLAANLDKLMERDLQRRRHLAVRAGGAAPGGGIRQARDLQPDGPATRHFAHAESLGPDAGPRPRAGGGVAVVEIVGWVERSETHRLSLRHGSRMG